MGGETTVDGTPELDVTVNGTAPVREVDLFRGSEHLATHSLVEGSDLIELTWTGARSKDRHKVQDWSGALALSAGRIESVEEVGFDHPTQGVVAATDSSVRWDGATAGNYQGLRLSLDAPDDAELRIATSPVSATVPLDELDGERTFDAGPVDKRLAVRRTGRSTTRDVETTFRDTDVAEGRHAYYVRLRQADGEMAWSSPIFVTVRTPTA
jgi:hypothetical protein